MMKKYLNSCWLLLLILGFTGCRSGSVEIFNGESLDGWECDPPELMKDWHVEEGMIVGENSDSLASIIWTTAHYKDFEIELDYMTPSKDYDSGIFTRGISHQVQIGISRSLQRDLTGCIYAPIDEQGSYPAQTDKIKEYHHAGEWNHLKVIVQGKRIQTFLNGEPFVDYQAVHIPEEGPVGLQLHGGVHMIMKFKNIKFRELPVEQSL
jgi:hypothetical protein